MIDRWPPLAWAALAAVLAVVLRLPYLTVPLTADEGGYAEVARLWGRGAVLYDRVDGIWVDRPQGLLWIFRALEHVDGGSTAALRVAAALVAAAVVCVTFLITERTAGRIPAVLAALLLAIFGSAPRIEAFTLSGEVLASLPSALALLAFVTYLRRGGARWLVVCGLLTGAAVMIKQSGFDGGLAAVAYLLWTRRRAGLLPAATIVGCAFLPVIAGALSAASFDDWWYAMVTLPQPGRLAVLGLARHPGGSVQGLAAGGRHVDRRAGRAGRHRLAPRPAPARACGSRRRRWPCWAAATSTRTTTSSCVRRWRRWAVSAQRAC